MMNPSSSPRKNIKGTPYAFWLVLIIFFSSLAISSLTPSFQSPDEDAHVKRAYLLAHGQVWLSHPPGKSTGGLVDQGLITYMEKFSDLPFHGERKISANTLYESKQIEWTGNKIHAPTDGISFYFPLIYAPQAIGIRIGEVLGLSVHASYQMAKVVALIATYLLLYWALTLHAFSALTVGLFILPMSLFQMGSASLDGIAHACCLMVIALYLKINDVKTQSPRWVAFLLCILIALLTTSRMHLLPLLLLPFLAHRITKQSIYQWGGIAASIFTVGWILASMLSVVDLRVVSSMSSAQLIAYYALHPVQLLQVLFNTFTSIPTLKSYATAFIGVLGWLDASLPKMQYAILGALLGLLAISCFSWRPKTIEPKTQITFVICALGSIAIIFLSLLVQWTPHPATIILGVQGRYFFVPALLLAVAFSRPITSYFSPAPLSAYLAKYLPSYLLLIALTACSLAFTSNLLLQRYYFTPEQIESSTQTLGWSKPFSVTQSTPIIFSAYQTKTPAKLQGISLLIEAPSTGKAALQLQTAAGSMKTIAFTYPVNKNATYLSLAVPVDAYISGAIIGEKEDGARLKLINSNDGIQRACIIYELSDGSRRYTPGCP